MLKETVENLIRQSYYERVPGDGYCNLGEVADRAAQLYCAGRAKRKEFLKIAYQVFSSQNEIAGYTVSYSTHLARHLKNYRRWPNGSYMGDGISTGKVSRKLIKFEQVQSSTR